MATTLIARISKLEQYNKEEKKLYWKDSTASRWQNVYSKLDKGYPVIFLADEKALIGKIESITLNESFVLEQVKEFPVSNDDFLRLSEVSPENISTVKANFHPFITHDRIDFSKLEISLQQRKYISFYIAYESAQQKLLPLLGENDRVIVVRNNGKIAWIHQFKFQQLQNLENFKNDLFGSKDMQLSGIKELHIRSEKKNNIAAVERMLTGLEETGFFKFKTFTEYYNIIHNKKLYRGINEEVDELEENETKENNSTMNLNTILYGPPGTGKTYNSINKAIEIIDKEFYKNNKDNRAALHDRFNDLLIKDFDKLEGQIAFCTFHQSMSYEDFIEGIKPVLTTDKNDGISYEIKDGIFKTIARMASDSLEEKEIIKEKKITLTEQEFNQALFYKMSLGNTQLEGDEEIYEYCIANECVAMGWGGNVNYAGMDENEIFKAAKAEGQTDFSAQQANMFIHYLKAGNYVIISNGNHRFRAIGRIIGEYEYRNDTPLQGYYHYKKVEWILKDQDLPVSDIYGRNFQQQTLYKLKQQEVKKEFFVNDRAEEIPEKINEAKKFVLIIDEINRGNVSQIFGELITLIEEDKRTGKEEALTVTLPYSKKTFSVPPNLYIIGTMNTADRSVEALDTALRRRFSFAEMQPEPEILSPYRLLQRLWMKHWLAEPDSKEWEQWELEEQKFIEFSGMTYDRTKYIALANKYEKEGKEAEWMAANAEDLFGGIVSFKDGVNLTELLNKINSRLKVLVSKDHTIGHAWLMNVFSLEDLRTAFKDKIIPLLQEFFYNDYAKIGLVLGENFIEPKPVKTDLFAKFKGSEELAGDYADKIMYELKDVAHIELQGFKSIYNLG